MQRTSKSIIETTLRNDPLVDNRNIQAALDAANGKTAAQMVVADLDTVLTRRQVAELLGCSLRTVDELGRTRRIDRILLTGTTRAKGYSAKSVRAFQERSLVR